MKFPVATRGLGVGIDLPWGAGFGPHGLVAPLRKYLQTAARDWSHAFFSWQPRDRAEPRLDDYCDAWDDLSRALPPLPLALHHTALNLGAPGFYRRGALLDFTNALCERYAIQWINEDVGLWSLAGRPVPYPLPPLLNFDGLRATVANVRECQAQLSVPLLLEFPGFADGVSVVIGDWHAYDFFARLARETASPVTLDVAHLLSWPWWRGRRGAALFDELDRLPLDHCFEIHLSGCEIAGERFIDAHHGRLLDEQYQLLARLLELCPNLRAVTFEDPRVDASGALEPDSARSWQRLKEMTASWIGETKIARAAS